MDKEKNLKTINKFAMEQAPVEIYVEKIEDAELFFARIGEEKISNRKKQSGGTSYDIDNSPILM